MQLFGLFLALGMVITGSINVMMAKLQNKTTIPKWNGTAYYDESFNHPAFQTWIMFIGETLCLGVFYLQFYWLRRKASSQLLIGEETKEYKASHPWYIFLLPALCDITATTLMNIGLLYVASSVYQMLRGASVLFTALFSVIFLKNRLRFHHFVGLFLVISGITLVGVGSILYPTDDNGGSNVVLGTILIIVAQVVVATQFIVEEKFIGKYQVPPLLVVGSEGIFGFLLVSAALPAINYIQIDGSPIEDISDAFNFMKESWVIDVAVAGYICSIAFFNFFGVSVTKYLSSTHRSTIDSCRTLVIWIVSLIIGWESFIWIELVGFIILANGTFIYNEVYRIPFLPFWKRVFSSFPSLFVEKGDPESARLLVNAAEANSFSNQGVKKYGSQSSQNGTY